MMSTSFEMMDMGRRSTAPMDTASEKVHNQVLMR